MSEYNVVYKLISIENELGLLGPDDLYLKAISNRFNVSIRINEGIIYSTSSVYEKRIEHLFYAIEVLLNNNITLTLADFYSILNNIDEENYKSLLSIYLNKEYVYTTVNNKSIYPRTLNQKIYINALSSNDIVFGLGPAGTGKTFLAVMYALKLLKSDNYKKIILVRPVVEAGEKLGFLPGDLKEKIDPYLIPIYDALNDGLGKEVSSKLIEKGIIEVAPLAYMRGRTLEKSIIILDEAQNTTTSQMKMFLTRLGFNSKMIITGDITQIDLLNKNQSGLVEATRLLNDIKGIKIVKFSKSDASRHPLVYEIIKKYEDED